jgi:hypothetical protein
MTSTARCEYETGTTRKGWKGCRRKAIVTIRSRAVSGFLFLNYCKRHAKPASA